MATSTDIKPQVLNQLNELFGNVLSLEIIESVALGYNFDVQKSSNKLLEMSMSFSGNSTGNNVMSTLNKPYGSTGAICKSKSKKCIEIEKTIEDIQQGLKVLVILRGLPGSGKTHLARHILSSTIGEQTNGHLHVLSTDDYFYKHGRYVFDANKLSEAHGWNHNRAFKAMSKGVSPVIIDNTNKQMWEMKPYAGMGTDFGYILRILEPDTHWCFNEKELAKRNLHNVSKQRISELIDRFEKNVTTQKLMAVYNLKYERLKPPQFRQIPPVARPNNFSNNAKQTINKSQSVSALNNDFHRQRNVAIETINLMDFNDATQTRSQEFTLENWDNDPVDQILMWKQEPQNNDKVLKPHNVQDTTVPNGLYYPDDAQPEQVDLENAWGISEKALLSWDIVSPLPNHTVMLHNHPQTVTEKPATTTDASCGTELNFAQENVRILKAVNRDINANTPVRTYGIPKKIMTDKSCLTEGLLDEDDDIAKLMSMFPDVARKHLIYLYRNCRGDVVWTTEMILDSKDDLSSWLEQEEIEAVNLIPDPPAPEAKISTYDAPENKQKKRFVQSDELKTKLFNSIDHTPVKKRKEPTPSTSKIETCPTQSGEVIMIDSDIEFDELELDDKSDCGSETVELNLGLGFVEQLENKFGDPNMAYPKGFLPVVQVPKDLARQLYTFYIESVFQQMDAQNEVLDSLVKEDEELARQLQEQEQNNQQPQAVSDESLHFSGQWGSLTPDTLADKLTKMKLAQTFPKLDAHLLMEIYNAHDKNYQDTVEILLASAGEGNVVGSREEVKQPPINDAIVKEMKEAQALSPACEEDSEERFDAVHYRDEANKHLQRRKELIQRAQVYHQKGMNEVAQFYSNLAAQQTQRYDKANNLAAATFLNEHSNRLQDFNTIDLHFLYVKEAVEALDQFLDKNINLLQGSNKQSEYLHIITGRGKRSINGVSKIKPAVIARLKKRHLRFNQLNPGLLKVKISQLSLVTNDVSQ
ncbi:unnamed protein product [Brassicogethes aeneus]|uniref:NEDD4-binding protein 2 n=1 Tax=Brassicogethes aeneus TaxID=1431903 RepID=A0A9P0B231_BRAAE|nr:unnamed protein product [Brassicogethes aeneus]